MSDFIEKARALERYTFGGPWTWELGDADRLTMTTHGSVPFTLIDADHFRGSTEDAAFIAAARTMLPAAVEALARVRELHGRFSLRRVDALPLARPLEDIEQTQWCTICKVLWPCATYQATEVQA